jgi:hypothetical protein
VAKLAIESPTQLTHLSVVGYLAVSPVAFVGLRRLVAERGLGT